MTFISISKGGAFCNCINMQVIPVPVLIPVPVPISISIYMPVLVL